MANDFGGKQSLGFKPQAVAATPEATVTTFLSTESFSMNANHTPVERKSMAGVGIQLPNRKGWINPSGACSGEYHASKPQPFYWAMGAVATTNPGSGTAYLHTITDGGAPVRLTVEGDKVFHKAKQGDAYLSKWTLNFKPGEIATLELEWLSLSHEDGATCTSTPAFTTDPMICNVAAITTAAAQRFDVLSGSISWDGQLEQLPVLQDVTDGLPKVIRRTGPPQVSGSFDFIDFPVAELVKLRNATELAVIVSLTGAVIEGAYKKSLTITLPACQWTGGLDNEISNEVITGSAELTAFYDVTTSKQITVAAQNSIATINA